MHFYIAILLLCDLTLTDVLVSNGGENVEQTTTPKYLAPPALDDYNTLKYNIYDQID